MISSWPAQVKAPLSAKWLLAPLAIFGLLLASLSIWGIRSLIVQRRAAKKYARLLGYNSSSNPS